MSNAGANVELAQADKVTPGSNRSFGIFFAVVFLLVSSWPLFYGGAARVWALIVALAFIVTAIFVPTWLSPLNKIWFRFGLLLHGIVNPIVMGFIFFLTVTPIALILKLKGKTPLPLRFDTSASSYWIERDPPGPAPDSMKNQF